MAGPLPMTILLALGASALGGPNALRALLEFAGRSPSLDIAICIFVIGVLASPVLGTVLLARFVRKARPRAGAGTGGAPGAAPADCFAQMTLLLSLGVAFLVALSLLVVPFVASGGLGALRPVADFAGKSSVVFAIVIGAAASVRCAMPLLRTVRGAGNASGAAPAARATTSQTVHFVGLPLAAICLFVVVAFVASGGFDAQLLFPGFPWRAIISMPVGVAIATVAGTTLLVRFSRRARNAAGAGAAVPLRLARTRGASAS